MRMWNAVVYCDAEDCDDAIAVSGENDDAARANAAKRGWSVVPGTAIDVCPGHGAVDIVTGGGR